MHGSWPFLWQRLQTSNAARSISRVRGGFARHMTTLEVFIASGEHRCERSAMAVPLIRGKLLVPPTIALAWAARAHDARSV
jgi:hypothetical protein